VEGLVAELAGEALRAVEAEGVARDDLVIRRRLAHLRFAGQDATVEVEIEDGASLEKAFEKRYLALFGHRPEGRDVELESVRVIASSRPEPESLPAAEPEPSKREPVSTKRSLFDGAWREIPVFERETLAPGATLAGPALVLEAHSATVIEPAWTGVVDGAGALVLRADSVEGEREDVSRPEAVRLELFTNRFFTIAREMGERLRHTAVSTNVKERLDFSCALLDPEGLLVVNAPHIPVHLGAIGLCVRRLRETIEMEPGDVVVTNHPAFGGSHLPDVTVVTPVFHDETLLGYVANRAHHAEIGGTRPGSMPPTAGTLAEEGVVIAPAYIARRGEYRWGEIRRILEAAPWPTRTAEDNLADLRAAAAANHAGAQSLLALSTRHGCETVLHYMSALERLAEERIRDALSRIPDGEYEATEPLDDGSPVRVRIRIEGDRAGVDFEGTAPVHPGSLNAPPAVVHSAVIYVLRLLLREPLPLNEGLMRAVDLNIPEGMLNPPFSEDPERAPAIVGGNVETSQRIVDTLIKALGLAACSQGTMNNVTFGSASFGYYETVCGGCGAGPDHDGADAVHSHMTNTRITDVEVIEHRYPVRIERFAIRRGSGGEGQHRGGDGVVRELTFLEPAELSVLTQHRTVAPFGMKGGNPGKPGTQRVVRASGETEELDPIAGCTVSPNDRFLLETPGGGGWGRR
jgi:5-oxoprolinase (ATP-hydrolysing)